MFKVQAQGSCKTHIVIIMQTQGSCNDLVCVFLLDCVIVLDIDTCL